jgi:phosphoenolpyruvate carboxykinase (ATP)
MRTMLIQATREELANFGKPDFTIYNAGEFPANRLTQGVNSRRALISASKAGNSSSSALNTPAR